jgi:Holliday junction resolvasome RuvABC endonuclease subunit
VRILGIDPSLSCTALVFLGGEMGDRRATISTKPAAFASQTARLDFMRCALRDHVATRRPPELAVVEGYAFGAKINREVLGEWGGLLRLTLYRSGVPFVVVPPATLKAFVTGAGNAEKSLVLREVFRRWGYEAADDNDADAYGLAQLGRVFLGGATNERERKAIAKLERVEPLVRTAAAAE